MGDVTVWHPKGFRRTTQGRRRGWDQDAKRRLTIDAEDKTGKRVASFETSGRFPRETMRGP